VIKKKPKKKVIKKTLPRKTAGRKCLLDTPHRRIQQKMVKALSNGHYLEIACVLSGISQGTYFNWIERGEAEYNRLQRDHDNGLAVVYDEKEKVYLQFLEATRIASAQAEDSAIIAIRKAYDKDDWRAAAMFLERRFAKRWRRTDSHEIGGPNGGPIRTASVAVEVTDTMTAEQATDAYLKIMRDND